MADQDRVEAEAPADPDRPERRSLSQRERIALVRPLYFWLFIPLIGFGGLCPGLHLVREHHPGRRGLRRAPGLLVHPGLGPAADLQDRFWSGPGPGGKATKNPGQALDPNQLPRRKQRGRPAETVIRASRQAAGN